jgi:hypothetical protein
VRDSILKSLDALDGLPLDELLARRYDKFRRMGTMFESVSPLYEEPPEDPEQAGEPEEAAADPKEKE